MGSVVGLINLVGREVCRIDVGRELRFERCTNGTEFVKIDSTEKFMGLDLVGINSSKAMFGITNKANSKSARYIWNPASGLTFGSSSLLRVPAEHLQGSKEIGAS